MNIKTLIYRRPHMRSQRLMMLEYVGKHILDNCFDIMQISSQNSPIILVFPERWLNVIEERALIPRLEYYYPNVTEVTIHTHSVYIIQCIDSKCSSIVCTEEEVENGLISETNDLTVRLWSDGFNGNFTGNLNEKE